MPQRATCPCCSTAASPCWRPPWTSPGRSSSTPPSAWAATARSCCGAARARGWSASTATSTPSAWPVAGSRSFGERVTLVHAVYDRIGRGPRRPRPADRAGRPARPRGVVAAARRGRRGFSYSQDAPLDMRMDQTHRAHRGRRAQHLPRRRPGPGAAALRRGAVRPPDRRRRRARARRRTVQHQRAPGRPGPRERAGRDPPHRRQPGQAHLPGAADRGERRARGARARPARPRSTPSPSAVASS